MGFKHFKSQISTFACSIFLPLCLILVIIFGNFTFQKFKDIDYSEDVIVVDSSLPAVLLNFRFASVSAENNAEDKQKVSSSALVVSSLFSP